VPTRKVTVTSSLTVGSPNSLQVTPTPQLTTIHGMALCIMVESFVHNPQAPDLHPQPVAGNHVRDTHIPRCRMHCCKGLD